MRRAYVLEGGFKAWERVNGVRARATEYDASPLDAVGDAAESGERRGGGLRVRVRGMAVGGEGAGGGGVRPRFAAACSPSPPEPTHPLTQLTPTCAPPPPPPLPPHTAVEQATGQLSSLLQRPRDAAAAAAGVLAVGAVAANLRTALQYVGVVGLELTIANRVLRCARGGACACGGGSPVLTPLPLPRSLSPQTHSYTHITPPPPSCSYTSFQDAVDDVTAVYVAAAAAAAAPLKLFEALASRQGAQQQQQAESEA